MRIMKLICFFVAFFQFFEPGTIAFGQKYITQY